jgi:hypothetical protein
MENGIPGPFARPGDFFLRENVRGMLLPVKLKMDWFLPMEEEP